MSNSAVSVALASSREVTRASSMAASGRGKRCQQSARKKGSRNISKEIHNIYAFDHAKNLATIVVMKGVIVGRAVIPGLVAFLGK